MSESANCEEQREEQTELEEAGGAEVGWFLKWALSLHGAAQLHLSQRVPHKPQSMMCSNPYHTFLVRHTQSCKTFSL